MRSLVPAVCALALILSCDEGASAPGGDAGDRDSGASDSGTDAGRDSGTDTGSTCTCSTVGECCDGCHSRNIGLYCDDGLSCSALSTCATPGVCAPQTSVCTVTWPDCQARACDETTGCGAATPIRNGFTCNDGNDATYDDVCSSGTCAGTPLACSVSNGGCVGSEVCVGHDPAPNTCECASGRYQVTTSTVLDTTSGRTWQRGESSSPMTFAQAQTYCANLSTSGGGWRLPTSDELEAIHTGASGAVPRIDGCAFPGTSPSDFRSSTAWTSAGYHRVVDFGGCCGAPGGLDTMPYPVRCVR